MTSNDDNSGAGELAWLVRELAAESPSGDRAGALLHLALIGLVQEVRELSAAVARLELIAAGDRIDKEGD